MMIIGCDLHTRYQQIAMVDTDNGELVERRLEHESGEARVARALNCQNYHNSGCPVLRARCEGRASLASTSFGSNVKKGADLYRRRPPVHTSSCLPPLRKARKDGASTSQSGKEKRLVKGYRGEILLPRVCEPIDAPASQS